MVNSELAQPFTDRFGIAKQTDLDPREPLFDPFRRITIAQRSQPEREFFGLPDLKHVYLNTQPAVRRKGKLA